MPTIQVGPGSDLELQEVADIMGNSKKVVVVTGAGISTNCGIPDFRSENGLYSLIQAQYDAAIKNPPWEHSNIFDIDDRPKKKRKQWYYEVVAPDGKVVDVIDEEIAPPETSQPDPLPESQQPHTPRRSSRSRSSNTTNSNSRTSTPSIHSSAESSLSSCSSITPEVPLSFSQNTVKSSPPIASDRSISPVASRNVAADTSNSIDASSPLSSPISSPEPFQESSPEPSQESSQESSPAPQPSQSQNSSSGNRQSLPNLKGRDLFDSMVWQDAFTTSIFYMFISSLRQKVQDVASTTHSHKFLRVLRDGGRLVRNYSQNIDLLEEREGLCTDLAQGTGSKARFSRRGGGGSGSGGCESVTLHGSLEWLRCSLCNTKSNWDDEGRITTTLAGSAPDCPTCQTYSNKRTGNGRRKLAIGRLRPDIVLYGEEHPNANLIAPLVTHDLALGPDVLLIMGTSLRVHGLKIMVREFAKAVHSRGGKVVFVNQTKPSESTWGDIIDYWVSWDCDQWVLDLKDRREDLWLPPGAVTEERRKSVGACTTVPKRPQCKRDDKINGVYITFKILDQLGTFKDDQGQTAKRSSYWTGRALPAKKEPAKKQPAKTGTKHTMKFTQVPKGLVTEQTTSKPKRKSAPARIEQDTYPQNNQVAIVTKYWEKLQGLAPGLGAAPQYLRTPLAPFSGNEKPDFLKPFAFNSSSNHLPNIGTSSDWLLSKINLVSHPPSGTSIPIHTPKPEERKAAEQRAKEKKAEQKKVEEKQAEEKKAEERKIVHSYGTRASKRFSAADTIVVDSGEVETVLQSGEVENPTDEREDTIVVDETACTPASDDRIKRSCSIGAIVSSPEEGTTWHDAQEVL
ncbi:hypothetical protein ONS96_008675 [Cadophora gregata f. sp. sojae]|nr:hypothetical protein ONS96_008675 [Cadophora gregata f. sp. sojae]